jgi:tRNA threonylcarbamoyladenosine biosynthesis protein TsaB
MKTIALDTSGRSVGIAILDGEHITYEIILRTGLNHSQVLLPEIDHALKVMKIGLSEIDLFAATTGPGSFTGLRIGLSTLKGLALSWQKPLVGVSTLEALACNVCDETKLICPILKGPMTEIYVGLYRFSYPAQYTCLMKDRITDIDALVKEINEPAIFLGEGALQHKATLQEKMPKWAQIMPETYHCCRPSSVAAIGIRKYLAGDCQDVVTLVPDYLRVSEAELKKHGA